MNLFWIIFGVVLAVIMMVLVINPPEAWIKRVFHGKSANQAEVKRKE